jgi:ATP-binding cassette subfamily C protein CydD
MSVDKRVLQVDRRASAALNLSVAIAALAAALLMAQAWLLSDTVSRVFLERQSLSAVQPLLVALLVAIVLRSALIWGSDVVAQRAASRVKDRLRTLLTQHLLTLGPTYTRTERSGELANTVGEGVEALDEYITHYQHAKLLAGIVPALVFLVVLLLDPLTTLVFLFAAPMLLLLLALIGSRTRELSERRFAELNWMSAHFLDMLQGLTTLKLFGRSKDRAGTIEDISRQFGRTTMRVLQTAFQTSLVLEWAAVGATAFVALEVSLRLQHHLLPFSTALAVLLLTPEFFLPLRQLALRYHAGTAGKAAARRMFALLDTPERGNHAITSSAEGTTARVPPRSAISFADVHYAYDGGQRPALNGLTLNIPNGQTLALVGSSGAGKTTVASLLLRFIEPDAGTISVGGTPLHDIDRVTWRSLVGWVPQQPHLFYGTIADNIRLARPDAGPEDVEAAARAAHAHTFIQALPLGYDTPIHERGTRLSGGQRQRIAIARTYLKDPPMLILDEATSHLDAENEAMIQDALVRLMRGRTVLIIAHRLAMVYHADQIVVMDHGRAIERGAHRVLVHAGGLYQTLVSAYEGGKR